MQRVKTGVYGLDEIIQGGFPKESITLLSGPPGGGKSIFCFQFIYEGAKNGERCLFLTLDKKIEGLLTQAEELGFDFKHYIDNNVIKFIFLNINKKLVYETMTNEILSGNYDRIVLDSITPLSEMPIYIRNIENNREFSFADSDDVPDDINYPVKRMHLRYIMNALETSKSTSIVTSELPKGCNQLSRDGISEFLADGVITLSIDPTMDRRKISVAKMRNTKHTLKPHDMEIDQGGIKIT